MTARKSMFLGFSALLAGVMGLASANSASADGYYAPCQLQRVVTYVCRTVPYQACVVDYDCFGRPYETHVTRFREVHVPVVQWVRVCSY